VREYQQYIGGQWISSGRLFDDLDPYRGTVMARIPAGTQADAARAVDAAALAFPGGPTCPRPGSRPCSCAPRHRRTPGRRDHCDIAGGAERRLAHGQWT